MARLKTIRRALRKPFETAGYTLLLHVIPLFPRRAVTDLSKWTGWLASRLPLRENQIGMKNLDAVFGDIKSLAEKKAILASSFATFCLTMLDIFWFSKNTEHRIQHYVEFDPNFDSFFTDRAKICITAHFGNWEIIAQAVALRGINLASIAAPVKNKAVDRMLINLREKTGQTIIPQKGALRTLITRLRKNGAVAFVLDQNTPAAKGGIVVDFLGLPMSVSAAPAALAYRTGTEIFFGFCIPQKNGKYRVYSSGTLQPPVFDKAENAARVAQELTQEIQNRVSKEIRTRPHYWLWSYKHWRQTSASEYPRHYPAY